MSHPIDPWESGEQYEIFMGRWSRKAARDFLRWLPIPEERRWIDVGTGTGILSSQILDLKAPVEVLAIDPSEQFIAFAGEMVPHPAVKFKVGSAYEIPADSDQYDGVVSSLVLNFIPDLARALAEMRRVTRPGGIAAGYVWDYAGKMEMLRYFWDAVIELDPGAGDLDEGRRFELCNPGRLEAAFMQAAFSQVETRAIDVRTPFENFEAYWQPFMGGIGPAGGYAAGLNTEHLSRLKRALRTAIPAGPDGKIDLIARAWAVRGVN